MCVKRGSRGDRWAKFLLNCEWCAGVDAQKHERRALLTRIRKHTHIQIHADTHTRRVSGMRCSRAFYAGWTISRTSASWVSGRRSGRRAQQAHIKVPQTAQPSTMPTPITIQYHDHDPVVDAGDGRVAGGRSQAGRAESRAGAIEQGRDEFERA